MKTSVVFLLLWSLTFTAGAMAAPKQGEPFELNQFCEISGTSYSLIMQLTGAETKLPFTPQWDRNFSGTMKLLDGVVPLTTFYGEGVEGYTGKKGYYNFSAEDSRGRAFSLSKKDPYIAPNQFTLETDAGGGIRIVFDARNLRCETLP